MFSFDVETSSATSYLSGGGAGSGPRLISIATSSRSVATAVCRNRLGYGGRRRRPSKGEPYPYPSVARLLVSDYLQRAPERETFEPLSDREREVLRLVAEGKTNRQIADTLFLSIKTVQTHRDHIMKKLRITTAPSSSSTRSERA